VEDEVKNKIIYGQSLKKGIAFLFKITKVNTGDYQRNKHKNPVIIENM